MRCPRQRQEEKEQLTDLNEENERKRKEIEKMRQEIKYLETHLNRTQEEILVADASLSEANTKLFQTKQKTALLKHYSVQSNQQMSVFDCLSEQITKHFTDSEKLLDKEKPVFYCLNSAIKTETACQKNVRENVEKIFCSLQSFIQNQNNSFHKAEDLESVERVWQKNVKSTLEQFRASDILEALTNMADNATSTLNQKVLHFDYEEELSKIKKRYDEEKKGTGDSSNLDIYQLMSDGQKSHILNYINTKTLLADSQKDKVQLQDALTQCNDLIENLLREEPQKLTMAKDLLQREVKAAAVGASTNCIEKEISRLKEEVAQGEAEKKLLDKKYEQIRNMESLIQRRMDVIKQVLQDSYILQENLNNNCIQTSNHVEENLQPHKESVQNFVSDLKNAITDEVNKFLDVSLPRLMTVDIDGSYISKSELSINQMNPDFVLNPNNYLREIAKAVDFPAFKSPESMLSHICQLKVDVMKSQLARNLSATAPSRRRFDSGKEVENIEKLNGLVQAVGQSEEQLKTTVHSQLRDNLKTVTNDIGAVAMLKQRVEEWEKQPAQYCVPWVQVGGLTFDQWLERWKVAATQLRQHKAKDLN
ncbi:hypothetical protein Ahia01_000473100 [Argonauta hians]